MEQSDAERQTIELLRRTMMELSDAERQMIDLLRNNKQFLLTVSRDGDGWHVHPNVDPWRVPPKRDDSIGGLGPTFDRAWDDARLRGTA